MLCAVLLTRADAATTERIVVDRHSGLALGGIDPVAYFTESKAAKGAEDFEIFESGAVWRFRSDGNREAFRSRPDIYRPQFGGYDPVDAARGVTVAARPALWLIVNDRLYLFSREDNRTHFTGNAASVLRDAARNWPRLLETLAE